MSRSFERAILNGMNQMPFSQRLYGVTANIIYLALIVGFSPSVVRHHQLDGTAAGATLMMALLVVYAAGCTFGWRYVLRQRAWRFVYGYFALQLTLFALMFWLENADTRNGAGVGNLSAVLLLQGGVLPVRGKWALYLASTVYMIAVSALFLPLDNVLLPSLVVFATHGAIALIGHLVVRDEQTQIALEAANRKLAEYATQVDELATMRERNRLAREIHDNLGHYLTVVNTQIEAARALAISDPPRHDALLERAQALTKEGLAEVRRSVAALRAAPIEARPLHEAIQQLVEEQRAAGLTIQYTVEGTAQPAGAPIEMALYRAAQEGLTNIRKHARATCADVQLAYTTGRVLLRLHDDGVGSGDNDGAGGFGLMGVQERVKLLGGTFAIDSARGAGFTLQVEVPL
jgi:signal transduction histidine kinase